MEAALKLARKAKKRTGIFAFMGGFHGMSLGSLSATSSKSIAIRGLGLIWGIDVSGFTDEAGAKRMTEISFENGPIIERADRGDRVLKIMPPLTVSMEHLAAGCDIIKSSMQQVISQETQDLLVTT